MSRVCVSDLIWSDCEPSICIEQHFPQTTLSLVANVGFRKMDVSLQLGFIQAETSKHDTVYAKVMEEVKYNDIRY